MTTTADELSDLEREILEFERGRWKYAGAKEGAVRERFDMTFNRYFQVLDALIDRPAAEAHDAATVRRLRRLRHLRATQRGRHAPLGTPHAEGLGVGRRQP